MTASEIIREAENLPKAAKLQVLEHLLGAVANGDLAQRKFIDRLLRRLENPDITEDVWRGIEEAEDGKLIDLDEPLTELDRP